ncbi:kelch repeat-containing protein [Paracidobacterium acidisoli]|nr:kelch repeat-containing protein [Paracidobacterium acidisoli]MBT9332641.1 chitobiase/beta-hexosaminidase C-terminal domain-containing protein [Paracidobacterium acidisoli]
MRAISRLALFPALLTLAMLAIGFFCPTAEGQTGEWAWMGGSSSYGQSGVYGTLGTPAAGNVPGSRYGAMTWTDSSGHLWLFGGNGFDTYGQTGDLNDLWEFDPATSKWTWISGGSTWGHLDVYGTLGTPAAANTPGAREAAVTWTDSGGHLWLFGGEGYDSLNNSGALNDLWEFDPATSEWTWMGGSNTVGTQGGQAGVYGTLGTTAAGNIPGGRFGAVSWTDNNGHLWLFGGQGFDSTDTNGYLNDLWEFDPATNQWTWEGGSSTLSTYGLGHAGIYGTLGTPATGNIPGGREYAMSWSDSNGHLWLFGGEGEGAVEIDNIPYFGYLNDLWEFDPATNQWTWEGGSSTVPTSSGDNLLGQSGVYGTPGTAAAGNTPGGRSSGMSWTDSNGHLWLFAGYGANSEGGVGYLNDLWELNTATNQWAWMGGSSTLLGAPGTYGTLGTPAAGNIPTAREAGMSWTDNDGHLWLFGGAFDEGFSSYLLNDLWEYTPAASAAAAATPTFSPAGGNYSSTQMVTISDATSGATIYYTTDGSTPTTSSTRYTGAITVASSETIKAIATASGYTTSAVASASYIINLPTFFLSVSPSSGVVYNQTVTLTATTSQTIPIQDGQARWWITEDGLDCTTNGVVCNAAPNVTGGGFITTTSPLTAGNHTFYAYYSATPPPNNTLPSAGTGEAILVVGQATPTITWATPAPIMQGTPLSSAQLDATASVPGSFVYNPASGAVLNAGQQTLSVTFTPNDTTDYTSATASVTLTVNAGTPGILLAPTSLSFSAQNTGSTSAAQSVTLTNTGSTALSIASIAASGDFAETNTCKSSVAAGANCTIAVTFTPTAGGTRTGSLTITDNAGGSPQIVPLTGTGTTVTESPSSSSLTVSAAGGSATDTIQFSSAGGFSGTVNLSCAVTYKGTGTAAAAPTCSLSPDEAQVSPGSAVSATLTVSTTAASARLGDPLLPWGGGALAAVLIFGVPRRRWRGLSLIAILCIALAGMCMGCGGGSVSSGGGGKNPPSNPGTTTGSYSVTVTATSGTITSSASIPLTVQ